MAHLDHLVYTLNPYNVAQCDLTVFLVDYKVHMAHCELVLQLYKCMTSDSLTAHWPLHPKYRTILTSCCSVWNMNWQWKTEWVSKWARVPASPPGCSCCPTSAPPSLTEPHKWQLQLSSVTSPPKIDGQVFLMETVTWSDFYGPFTSHTVSWILYLALGPNGLLLKSW